MLLYRALNEEDMKNLSLEEDILCQAREHDLNHASIIDIIFRKNNILPSFYIDNLSNQVQHSHKYSLNNSCGVL